jgi:hypothetical protein
LQQILLPVLPIYAQNSIVLNQVMVLFKHFLQENEHTLDMFGNIFPEIIMGLMITTRLKKSTVKIILKSYLRKTREYDGIYRAYLAVLEGKSLIHSTNRKDYGVK